MTVYGRSADRMKAQLDIQTANRCSSDERIKRQIDECRLTDNAINQPCAGR